MKDLKNQQQQFNGKYKNCEKNKYQWGKSIKTLISIYYININLNWFFSVSASYFWRKCMRKRSSTIYMVSQTHIYND